MVLREPFIAIVNCLGRPVGLLPLGDPSEEHLGRKSHRVNPLSRLTLPAT
jgi:hypothetical protein